MFTTSKNYFTATSILGFDQTSGQHNLAMLTYKTNHPNRLLTNIGLYAIYLLFVLQYLPSISFHSALCPRRLSCMDHMNRAVVCSGFYWVQPVSNPTRRSVGGSNMRSECLFSQKAPLGSLCALIKAHSTFQDGLLTMPLSHSRPW